MHWVLLVYIWAGSNSYGGNAAFAAEYNSREACETAAHAMVAKFITAYWLCTPKG